MCFPFIFGLPSAALIKPKVDEIIGVKFKGRYGIPMRVVKKLRSGLFHCVNNKGLMYKYTKKKILKGLKKTKKG